VEAEVKLLYIILRQHTLGLIPAAFKRPNVRMFLYAAVFWDLRASSPLVMLDSSVVEAEVKPHH
jgi:hypothetical protein